ncbi:MAG: hypothetical protein ACFCBW_12770 [Candidatus Competibacterales bacterium]
MDVESGAPWDAHKPIDLADASTGSLEFRPQFSDNLDGLEHINPRCNTWLATSKPPPGYR